MGSRVSSVMLEMRYDVCNGYLSCCCHPGDFAKVQFFSPHSRLSLRIWLLFVNSALFRVPFINTYQSLAS